ncbi:hypothetical protein QZH41_001467 [Actinostola sp. cb2023]|nr:hypothetical protein QZH41_001467 [Actinostola sp. cb2023]
MSTMPSSSSSGTACVKSFQDCQELIREVVQVVLAATAQSGTPVQQNAGSGASSRSLSLPTLPRAASMPVTQTQDSPGMSAMSITTFVSTFSLPSTPLSAITTESASMAGPTTTAVNPIAPQSNIDVVPPSSMPSFIPVLHQPFVVGPRYSPVPAKLVTQIVSGKCVDLRELIAANLVESANEPQLFFDGRVVLTSTPKRQRRRVEDIVTWMVAFGIYVLVLSSYFKLGIHTIPPKTMITDW